MGDQSVRKEPPLPAVGEGYTIEPLYGGARWAVVRSPSGLMATLDFEQRVFRGGQVVHGRPNSKAATIYRGRGWRQDLCDDAIEWLRSIER